jgi:hypothetical protein
MVKILLKIIKISLYVKKLSYPWAYLIKHQPMKTYVEWR